MIGEWILFASLCLALYYLLVLKRPIGSLWSNGYVVGLCIGCMISTVAAGKWIAATLLLAVAAVTALTSMKPRGRYHV